MSGTNYVFSGSNDVVIVETVTGGVAAEVELSAVIFNRIVQRVEDFRRHEVSRHEHVGALECFRLQHLRRLRRKDRNILWY